MEKLFAREEGEVIFLSALISTLTVLIAIDNEIGLRSMNLLQSLVKWLFTIDQVDPNSYFFIIMMFIRALDFVIEIFVAVFISFLLVGILFYLLGKIADKIQRKS